MGTEARQRKNLGPRGKGSIAILPQTAANKSSDHWREVKVVIFDKDDYKTVYHLDPEDITTEFGDWTLKPVKDVYIELTPDEEDIRSVRPWEGRYLLQFERFAARQDQESGAMLAPTIKHKPQEKVVIRTTGASWVNPPHDEFYAILKIKASEIGKKSSFDGIEVVKPLVYMFERNPDTGLVEIVWERKFWYDQLENFLTLTGYDWDADNLTPSENVLGELQEILASRSKLVRGNFSNGWLDRGLDAPPVGVEI